MNEEVAHFDPGTVVKLNSGGDLAMTVTSSDGVEVEVCYATNTKIIREKLLAVQLKPSESEADPFETARAILFILTQTSRELPSEEKGRFEYHLAELFKLLKSRSVTENSK